MTRPATPAAFYGARPVRQRATKAAVEERRTALFAIVDDGRPMTVRQVFYQATVRGLVEKTELGYRKIQLDLVKMRRDGTLPYNWLADNTRLQRKPQTFDSVEQALKDTAAFYRKSLWTAANSYVELWLEKDALWRHLSGHRDVRRAIDGGARLRQLVVSLYRRRIHQRSFGASLYLPPWRL